MEQPFKKGLEGVVAAETAIGHVDGTAGHLVYRGYWAKELAVRCTFEEAAYLLWHGRLPDERELAACKAELAALRRLTPEMEALLAAVPPDVPLMNALMIAAAAAGEADGAWPPAIGQAMRLTALLPAAIAFRYHRARGGRVGEARPEDGHAAAYLRLLFGREPAEAHVRALNAYLILAMEHGMNASTFTARVVASTEADLFAAAAAAIGAMKGPLHGGAPAGVTRLLEEIGTKERAEPLLRERLGRGERLMGFGHRVYKTRDPRAEALREVVAAFAQDDPWLDLAVHVEETAVRLLAEYKPGRALYANVEFYAAAVMRSIGMPDELFTPTFTAARMVGWTAHTIEQAADNRIFRPQSRYTGEMPGE